MPNVGTLSVTLKAQAALFHQGFDKARKVVKDFVGAIPGANLVLSRFGALMTAAAVGGAALFIRSQAEAIDSTAKLADRLGETTEALVGLQHAGSLAGSGAEEINAALEKMYRLMGEAAQGTEAAQDALGRLGLSVADLQGKRPVELFGLIGERIQGLATEQERAAAAADVFGRSGQALLNTLALGRDGIAAMEAEAAKLGLTFSRLDAAKVEAANDSLSRVAAVVDGLGRKLAVELAPYIDATARAFVEWATSGVGMGTRVADAVGWVVETVARAADIVRVLQGAAQVAGGVLVKVFAFAVGVVARLLQILEKVATILTLGFVQSDFGERMHAWADGVYDLGQAWVDAGSAAADSGWDGEASEAARKGMARIKEEAGKAAQELERQAKAAAATGQATTQGLPSTKEATDAAKKAADAAERELAARERLMATVEGDLRQRTYMLGLTEEQLEYGRELYAIEELRREGYHDLAAQAIMVLGAEKKAAQEAKDREAATKAADKAKDESEKASKAWADKRQAVADTVKSMAREVELLRAGNDGARERLRIQHELNDALEAAAGNATQEALAKERAALKLTDLARQEAEEAQRRADAEAKATKEKEKQAKLVSSRPDITKRFSNVGGSLFGFGAGQAGTGVGDLGTDAARAAAAAAKQGALAGKNKNAAGPAAQGAAQQAAKAMQEAAKPLEELAPIVKVATDHVKRLGSLWQQLGNGLREHTAETVRAHGRTADTVERGMSALAKGQADLRRRQQALEERVARAVSLGLGGS